VKTLVGPRWKSGEGTLDCVGLLSTPPASSSEMAGVETPIARGTTAKGILIYGCLNFLVFLLFIFNQS
jgi:hypothetical protein